MNKIKSVLANVTSTSKKWYCNADSKRVVYKLIAIAADRTLKLLSIYHYAEVVYEHIAFRS